MGTGKTTIGKILHQETGLTLIDSDKTIEQSEGCSIGKLFETKGETYFRSLETEFCRSLSSIEPSIIATGGGIVLTPENRQLLRQAGYVFWLDASPATIHSRVQHSTHRPLLKDRTDLLQFIVDTLAQRQPAYQECAHFYINTAHDSLHNCAKKIVFMLK